MYIVVGSLILVSVLFFITIIKLMKFNKDCLAMAKSKDLLEYYEFKNFEKNKNK